MRDEELVIRKREFRTRMRGMRGAFSQKDRKAAAESLFKKLLDFPELAKCRRLLGYVPAGSEIDVQPFLEYWLKQKKRLYLPRVAEDGASLEVYEVRSMDAVVVGFKGIREPDPGRSRRAEVSEVDAVLVPGLAYSQEGKRLGQGGGHYDRLLKQFHEWTREPLSIGICFEQQLVDDVPCGVEDEKVNVVVAG